MEIKMTTKELKKLDVLVLVSRKKMKMAMGAKELGISKRHFRRLLRRYEKEGAAGLAHKSRGKRSGNAFPKDLEEKIIMLLRSRYYDFGPTFAAEKISEDLGKKSLKKK